MKRKIPIYIVLILVAWTSYCFGYQVSLTANEKRKANLAYSHAKISLSVLQNNHGKNYEEANNKLVESMAISLVYMDAAKKDLESLSLRGLIFRPDIVLQNFLSDRKESLVDYDELNSLKADFDDLSKEIKYY